MDGQGLTVLDTPFSYIVHPHSQDLPYQSNLSFLENHEMLRICVCCFNICSSLHRVPKGFK